jgi:RNA polymerase sigma-70 factor (ECF subfamily)
LPEKVAQVFLLREIDGVSSEEICKDLSVSPNNLWVMLHRARMGLRRCLEEHWFATKRKGK